MRRWIGLLGALVLLMATATPATASRPWTVVTVDQVCRTPAPDAAIRFSLSWSAIHPDPVAINVWGGTNEGDPGTHYLVQISGHRLTGWTFSLPASDFDDHGYVLANVFVESRRGGWHEISNPPIYLETIGSCPAG
jgi:hypothetical protein